MPETSHKLLMVFTFLSEIEKPLENETKVCNNGLTLLKTKITLGNNAFLVHKWHGM